MAESSDEDYDHRWSLIDEMEKAFKTALQLSFPDIPDEDIEDPCLINMANRKLGDYECNNVLTMCLKKPPENMLLKHTAEAIKNNLPCNDMFEDCNIQSIGFLTFKLSRTWIARSVHKMLNEGIETWAPKLPVKSAIVNVSSRNIVEEMNVGHLRPTIIGDMLACMLDFSNVHVKLTNPFRDSDQFGMLIESVHENICKGQNIEVFPKESKNGFDEDAESRDRAHRAQLSLHIGGKYCINTLGYYNSHHYNQDTLNLLMQEKGLIEENEGDKVIFVKEKKTIRHDVFERKMKPLTLVKKNGVYDNALVDLSFLRYRLKEKKAEWIVYVADVAENEYFEMCFDAARRVGWLPTDEDEYPKTKFVGCGLAQVDDLNRSGKLVDLIDNVKTRCKAAIMERVKVDEFTAEGLENTAEELACGAVKYAVMKDFRVFKYALNVDEMLNDKGNTGVYLLYTYARICSIIKKSGKDIEELKMTRELLLEKDEERELGLHLLQFTEILEMVCTSVFPCYLCAFLYELAKKFTSYYSVGGVNEEANRLLVCEATRVVMRKCFHFLGITPIDKIFTTENMTVSPPVEKDDNDDIMELFSSDEDKGEMVSTSSSNGEDTISSSSGEEKTLAKRFKSSNQTLEEGEENKTMTPPLEPITSSEDPTFEEEKNPTPRFQLFSAYVLVDRYKGDCKPCFVFGSITVSDVSVSSEENGWVSQYDPDYGYTELFYRNWSEAVPIVMNGYINALAHPRTRRSIPFTDFLDISADLYVFNKDDNILFQVSHKYTYLSLPNVTYDKFSTLCFHGLDGVVDLVYSILSDPVDATLEMTLTPDVSKKLFSVKICAYYGGVGDDDYRSIRRRQDSHHLTLLEDDCVSVSLDNNKIPLNTSVMAVPANGSLVVDVLIKDTSGNVIVKEMFDFRAQRRGSNDACSHGAGCIFKLNVNWKC